VPRAATALALAVALSACGGAPAPAAPPSPSPLPAALEPARFLLGAWAGDRDSERWSLGRDALAGVGFTVEAGRTKSFEVMFVHPHARSLRFVAMPDGARSVPFELAASGEGQAAFANPAHDFPRRITYRRTAGGLAARIEDDRRGVDFAFRPAAAERAPELEEADLAFLADTSARGAEGWASWFDREGAQWRPGVGRVQGAEAIRAAMAKLLGDPAKRLLWAPRASGLSPAGDMGFTVGEWTLIHVPTDAAHPPLGRGGYVTIWRRQPDGGWRVWFDVGEPD